MVGRYENTIILVSETESNSVFHNKNSLTTVQNESSKFGHIRPYFPASAEVVLDSLDRFA